MKSSHHMMFKKQMAYLVIIAWGCQLLMSGPVWAAPQGGQVTSGAAAISQSGNVTTINQATQKAAINWQSFSTKPQEAVNFHQPNASAIALNRVIGNERSVLEGALNANGRVFLINSNGILFAKGSTVNTAGFIASTLNLTDKDFNAGNYVFKKNGATGSVINMGTITVKEGGYVGLLGPAVSNQGVIAATKGTVALASGDKVTLNFNGDSLVNVTVDEGALNALVENKQAVYADGGKVILTAKAADDLLSSQVNHSGIIEAKTIDDLKGSITLYAHGGTTAIDGTLDASAPITGDGGFIETSGDRVKIADTAFITTKSATGTNGAWLIDPTDFTIGEGGDITGTLISNFLKGTDIAIQSTMGKKGTDGNINVNEAVSWSANTTLALNAATDINVNAPVKATGANAGLTLTAGKDIHVNKDITLSGTNAALTMNYGGDYHIFMPTAYAGAVLDANGRPTAKKAPEGTTYASITIPGSNAGLTMNGTPYTLIHKIDDMATTSTLTGSYALAQNLDATAWSAANTGAASVVANLSGTLAGLGHTMSNLTLNTPSSGWNGTGLIGQTASGSTNVIRDMGLVDVNITGDGSIGALLGISNGGMIGNTYVTATVKDTPSIVSGSDGYIGGLIGCASNSGTTTITNSYSDANVTVTGTGNTAGGLVGFGFNTTIIRSHAAGNMTSTSTNSVSDIGGLGGWLIKSTVIDSYATGKVTASGECVGGLIGFLTANRFGPSSVTNSFATGDVTGRDNVAGLIGYTSGRYARLVTVDNCYATGNVVATSGTAGGLIGDADYTNISNSHATGNVTTIAVTSSGSAYNGGTGGLAGHLANGTITNSYATGDVTANGPYVGGLVGYVVGSSDLGHVPIINSHATGKVTGTNFVGGLTGGAFLVDIIGSWASGKVSGDGNVGGLSGGITGAFTNSYWNVDTTGQSNAAGLQFATPEGGLHFDGPDKVRGLTNEQWSDLPYYRDGTIDQVLADRAAAAARQAAFEADAGNLATTTVGQTLQQETNPLSGEDAAASDGGKRRLSLDDHIVFADSDTYGARIKAISADGVHFDLEDDSDDRKKRKNDR